MIALFASALAADCATHPTDAAVVEETVAVEAGLESGDPQRFEDGMRRLSTLVGCMGEVPRVETMASVRALRGVEAFGAGDFDRAAGEFLAARAIEPDLVLPVYPRDHGIYGVLRRLDPVRAKRERLPPPRRGTVFVDGYATRDRYAEAPALVQVVDGDSIRTIELGPGERPTYPVRHPLRNSLIVSASALAVAGGGLLLASRSPYGQFHKAQGASLSELGKLRSQTNALAGAGLGLMGAAVGVGTLAVVFRTR